MHFLWRRLQCTVGLGLAACLVCVTDCLSGVRYQVASQLLAYVKWLVVQPLHVHLRSCALQLTCFVTDERVRQAQGHLAVVCELTWPNPQHTTARHLHGCTDLRIELRSHACTLPVTPYVSSRVNLAHHL